MPDIEAMFALRIDESDDEEDKNTEKPLPELDLSTLPLPPVPSYTPDHPEDGELQHWPDLEPSHYDIPECEYTISTDHILKKYDFKFLRLSLHTRLGHIVCLSCSAIVQASALANHLDLKHFYKDIDPEIGPEIAKAYGLENADRVLNTAPCVLPPIAGIPLHPRPLVFCPACFRGYHNKPTLQAHCSKVRHEGKPMRTRFVSYGQRLYGCGTNCFIPVQMHGLYPNPDRVAQQVEAVQRVSVGNVDYSTMKYAPPENNLSMKKFFHQDGWNTVVHGFTPEEIVRARDLSADENHPYAARLRELCDLYYERMQTQIGSNLQFGLGPKLGSVYDLSPTEMGSHHFSRLSPPSQQKYALTLMKLVFNVIRHYARPEEWNTKLVFPPIDPETQKAAIALAESLSVPQEKLLAVKKKKKRQLTNSQKQMSEEEGKATAREHHLELLHSLLFKLFTQERKGNETPFFSPVIVFYVIHMVGEEGEVRTVSSLTNIAAHVMHSIRGCLGLQAISDAERQKKQIMECLEAYLPFLQLGRENIMVFFYNSLRYLVAARRVEQNKSNFVVADPHMNEMIHTGVSFTRGQVKGMIDAQVERYDSELKRLLFYGEDMDQAMVFPEVDFSVLKDDLNNRQRGYCLLMEPSNGFARFRGAYLRWLLDNPVRREAWLTEQGLIQRESAKAWLQAIAAIEVILAVGLLTSSGPSPRNTEFVRQLLRQELDCDRSFMIIFHCLSLTAVTDKSSHQRGVDKFVPHAPSRRWAVRLVRHMATLRPFAEFLISILFPGDTVIEHRYHFHLWPTLKGIMTDAMFRGEMARITYQHLGVVLSVKQWRQLTTLFAHLIQKTVNFHYPDNLLVDTLNMHSTKTSNFKYGGSGAFFTGSDPRQLACLVEASLAWHRIIDIDQDPPLRCGAPGSTEMSFVKGEGTSNASFDYAAIMDRFQEMENLLLSLQTSTTRNVEVAVASAFVANRFSSSSSLPSETDCEIEVPPALLSAFRSFLHDSKATFRTSGQAQLVGLGYENQQNVLAIIRTSSGKTSAMLFLATLSSRITVVFVPLVALRDNIMDDARAKGVTISQYMKRKTNTAVNILVFSLEHLVEDAFVFLMGLAKNKQVERVVFDEVHLYLTQRHFRPAFSFLDKLRELGVPIIYLSASVPPSSLQELQEATGISWTIIREPGSRKEIRYNLVRVETKDDEALEAIRYISGRRTAYGPNDRGLVFCRSVKDCAEVAAVLGVPAYYSTLENDVRKDIVSAWVRGDFNVLVNTPCLGTGFHYPSVCDVVHITGAYTMIDQYQEDSRGGRDGQECNASVFFSLPLPEGNAEYTPDPVLSDWLMEAGNECSRIRPSLYLDGKAKTCITLPNAAACTYCEWQLGLELSKPGVAVSSGPPAVPSTPTPRAKRPLDLSPNGIPIADKRMRERTGSGNISNLARQRPEVRPMIRPVTAVQSRIPSAFNVAQAAVPIQKFRENIEAPLEHLLSEAEGHCIICAFTKRKMRVKQGPHGTMYCKSGFHAYLDSDENSITMKQLGAAFDFPYNHACTTCGLPIRPYGAHLNPLGEDCPAKTNLICMTISFYYMLKVNKVLNLVPVGEMSNVRTYADWCASQSLLQNRKYDKVPIYNYWILTLKVWAYVKKQGV